MSETVLVVGNGMVGLRFCEKLTELDRDRQYRLVVFGDEPRPAYDRVKLTSYFDERSAEALVLRDRDWYAAQSIDLRTGTKVVKLDLDAKNVVTADGETVAYDRAVLATGSTPLVPVIRGIEKRGVFVYRTIEDLEQIVESSLSARSAAVIGGGLLGLEAARAVLDLGLEAHVVEQSPRILPRQLDQRGAKLLENTVHQLGVRTHLDVCVTEILGDESVTGLLLSSGQRLACDLVIVSAGIRPRDELARASGVTVGSHGGVVVNDQLRTNDASVFAIGEVALHRGTTYGLVGPGYEMADVLAQHLIGKESAFAGSDMSARLKLLGTDVATFGDPFRTPPGSRTVLQEDELRGTYRKLVFSPDTRHLLGGILVGDTSSYARLLQHVRAQIPLSETLTELGGGSDGGGRVQDDVSVCSCNNVSAGAIRASVRSGGCTSVAQIKSCTRAGSGCGGCLPAVSDLLMAELRATGRTQKPRLCEHFAFTRQELFQIVASRGIRTFADLNAAYGKGSGCEVCKPAIASILASIHNEPILDEPHRSLQDTNDRFLANIQRDGTYSVVPRVPGGELTADKLIILGQVAKKYKLYTKITGGQRIDLFGAQVDELPQIWEELVAAGFESGHAYGKAMRTVKSCVGSTWCRYGVQDSTAFAVRIEHRYKGIRAPHKLKSAVSGCVRECAEAQTKDFGLIATEKGWNVFVCGNGGAKPRHADLLASDVSDDTAIRYIDRFLMFYIRTADRLTRTSVWLDNMDGGIEHVRQVVVQDSLGIAADLERDMQRLVDSYSCEWADAVRDPKKRATFQQFSTTEIDTTPALRPLLPRLPETERKQSGTFLAARHLPLFDQRWVRVASVGDVPQDSGIAIRHGENEIALFHFASRNQWFASQNLCPHTQQMVLARGLLGDAGGIPKVACPLHKKTFDLESGRCLSGDDLEISTFPVRIEGDAVWVQLPPAEERRMPASQRNCGKSATG